MSCGRIYVCSGSSKSARLHRMILSFSIERMVMKIFIEEQKDTYYIEKGEVEGLAYLNSTRTPLKFRDPHSISGRRPVELN